MSSLFIYFLSTLLGLVIGSFLNVVIFRTEKEKDFGGRSYCPKCKKKLLWYDNIPLLSYLILNGRCRFCRKRISSQYPFVEMLTALAFFGSAYLLFNNLLNDWLGHYFGIAGLMTFLSRYGAGPSLASLNFELKFFELFFLWTMSSILIVILVYDLKHMLIPDSFIFAGVITATFYNILADALLLIAVIPKNLSFILEVTGLAKKYSPGEFFPLSVSAFLGWEPENFYVKVVHLKSYFPSQVFVPDSATTVAERPLQFFLTFLSESRLGSGLIAGLIAAFVFFLIVYFSNETWMGMGDVKLIFFLGLLLGFFKTAVALFLAFELGAILGIVLILSGRAKMKTALPFGPFLIVGAVLSLLFV